MKTKEKITIAEGLIKAKEREIKALNEDIQKLKAGCEHKFKRLPSHGYSLFECAKCGTTDWE